VSYLAPRGLRPRALLLRRFAAGFWSARFAAPFGCAAQRVNSAAAAPRGNSLSPLRGSIGQHRSGGQGSVSAG